MLHAHVIQLEDVGETIEKLRIGHDGKGFGSGWHLNKVEIRRLMQSGKVRYMSVIKNFIIS